MQLSARRIIAPSIMLSTLLIATHACFAASTYNSDANSEKWSQDRSYTAGDCTKNHGFWIRPFYEGGKQYNWGNLLGYRQNTGGIAAGFDEEILERVHVGLAVSIARTKVESINFYDTHNDISTRLATLYGRYQFRNAINIDWLLSGGASFNRGQRTDGVKPVIYHYRYNGTQYSVAATVSKEYFRNYVGFSPQLSLNYVYINHDAYTETLGGVRAHDVRFADSNVFTLGAGISGTRKIRCHKYIFKPEAQAMLYYDLVSGNQNSSSAFIIGGPALATTAIPGRLTGEIGASVTYDVNNRLNFRIEYDLQVKYKYFNNIAYINMRYAF